MDFELIVSEDNDAVITKDFIREIGPSLKFKVIHSSQPDEGFRKAKALNEALKMSAGEIIVFLDGDCIPHKHLIKNYIRHVQKGKACFGRRVFLNEKFTHKIISSSTLMDFGLIETIFNSYLNSWKYGIYLPFKFMNNKAKKGVIGCNWGINKQDLLMVNGFDESYVHAGIAEDMDIEYRLNEFGVKFQSLKNKAIVYHLWHKSNYTEADVETNRIIFRNMIENKTYFCKNGLSKI